MEERKFSGRKATMWSSGTEQVTQTELAKIIQQAIKDGKHITIDEAITYKKVV